MGMNSFERIFYINLDHRKDRREKILNQLEKLKIDKEKIERISGVFDPLNGARGCALSHVNALELAIEKKLDNVLILEDDCEFVQLPSSINRSIEYFFDTIKDWDVFFLGCFVLKSQKTSYPEINRILKAYLAHSYAVNKHYMKILKECFEKSCTKLREIAIYNKKYDTTIDNEWHELQKTDKWYMLDKLLTKQSNSYSDIDKINKDNKLKSNLKFK